MAEQGQELNPSSVSSCLHSSTPPSRQIPAPVVVLRIILNDFNSSGPSLLRPCLSPEITVRIKEENYEHFAVFKGRVHDNYNEMCVRGPGPTAPDFFTEFSPQVGMASPCGEEEVDSDEITCSKVTLQPVEGQSCGARAPLCPTAFC